MKPALIGYNPRDRGSSPPRAPSDATEVLGTDVCSLLGSLGDARDSVWSHTRDGLLDARGGCHVHPFPFFRTRVSWAQHPPPYEGSQQEDDLGPGRRPRISGDPCSDERRRELVRDGGTCQGNCSQQKPRESLWDGLCSTTCACTPLVFGGSPRRTSTVSLEGSRTISRDCLKTLSTKLV